MEALRIGLEWFVNPDHVPFLVALERGWFAEAGLDVTLIEPEQHLDAVEAIEKGAMDVAITEPIHLVEDRSAGKPVVGFARFLHTNGGVMYLGGSGIERPRDMAGARIQYPGAPGPGGPAIVSTMIGADGGSYAADAFTPVNKGFYHTDALAEGKADVATLAFYNFELVEARHRGLDARFFALKDWGIPDFCQLVLITTPELLSEREEALQALVRVLQRGLDFIHQEPAEARAIYYRRTEADPGDAMLADIFAATVPCFTFDFSMSVEYYDALQRWMRKHGLAKKALDPASYWSNRLVF